MSSRGINSRLGRLHLLADGTVGQVHLFQVLVTQWNAFPYKNKCHIEIIEEKM